MGNDGSHEPPSERGLDEALRAAFESRSGDSVLKRIEELTGVKSRVLIHDDVEDPSPMIRVQGLESEPAEDDSRYQIVGEIARGGVGVVHKARDRDLGRDVALKVLRHDFADNSQVFARFIEEAQIGGQLQHPGIVPVYGMALQPDGRPSFAMKLIKGRTLAAALKERKSPAEDRRRFLATFEQVALTMGYAHARGVIHRDLKPSNILVGNFGEVLVVDWGFGKVLGRPEPETPETTIVATVRSTGEGSESLAGSVMGTPAYMPPEQALGQVEEMDEQSDVFALGSILTEILTGKPAYAGESRDLLGMAARGDLGDAFERLDACEAEPAMVDLARRCLAPLRKNRPDDAMAAAKEVGEHLTAAEERARQAELQAVEERARLARETKQAAWERKARRKVLALAACVLVAVLLGGGAYLKLDSDRRSRAEAARPAAEQAMEEATRLGGRGKWTEAIAVARKAVALAEEADEETRDRAKALFQATTDDQAAADAEAEQAETDRAFVSRLEETRALAAEHGDAVLKDTQVETLFRNYGLDLVAIPPESIATRLKERGIAVAVASILDEQSMMRRHHSALAGSNWELLLRIATLADPDPLRSRLRSALRDNDAQAILAIAEDALTQDLPTVTLNVIGAALQRSGHLDKAVRLLRVAHRSNPGDFWLAHSLARALASAKAWDPALRYITAALALRPDSWLVWGDLGHVQLYRNELEAAESALRRSLALNPDVAVNYVNLSAVLYATGRREEAMASCRKALELSPEEPVAHNNLGRAFADLRRFEEAEREFEAAIQVAPGYFLAHRNLGNVLLRLGEDAEAIAAYQEAIRLDPRQAKTYTCLAEVYTRLYAGSRRGSKPGPYHRSVNEAYRAEAVRLLREAERLEPLRAYFGCQLAFLLEGGDRIDEAVEVYRAALRTERSELALLNLASALVGQGKLEEAAEALHSLLELRPGLPVALCNLGTVLLRQGKFEEGLATLRRGHEAGTRRPGWRYPSGLWVQAAETLVAAGRLPEGAKVAEVVAYLNFWGLHGHAARICRETPAAALADVPAERLAAAAMAGCGRGFLAPEDETEHAGWRRQALAWLREDLEREREGDPLLFRWRLWKWSTDPNLSGVRDEAGLAKLPDAERAEWTAFWDEVREVLAAAKEGD